MKSVVDRALVIMGNRDHTWGGPRVDSQSPEQRDGGLKWRSSLFMSAYRDACVCTCTFLNALFIVMTFYLCVREKMRVCVGVGVYNSWHIACWNIGSKQMKVTSSSSSSFEIWDIIFWIFLSTYAFSFFSTVPLVTFCHVFLLTPGAAVSTLMVKWKGCSCHVNSLE